MKKILCLMIIVSFIVVTITGIEAAPARKNRGTNKVTGFFWGFDVIGGISIGADPDRMTGKSGTYWSAASEPGVHFGGQFLVDMYYYFKPFIALNLGLGFGSYQTVWRTSPGHNEGFGNPEVMDYRGFNIIPRLGVTNLWGDIFFLSAGLHIAPTVYSIYTYSGTAKTHIFKPNDLPWGVYANLGVMIRAGKSVRIPIGIEYMLFDRYAWDYNGYRIIMHSVNLFVGVQF